MFSKVEVKLSKDDLERLYREEVKRDKIADFSMLGLSIVILLIAIAEYFSGRMMDAIESGVLSLVGFVITGINMYMTHSKRKALDKLRKIAEEKGEVKILTDVVLDRFKIVE